MRIATALVALLAALAAAAPEMAVEKLRERALCVSAYLGGVHTYVPIAAVLQALLGWWWW